MVSMPKVAIVTGGGTGSEGPLLCSRGEGIRYGGRSPKEPLEATAAEGSRLGARMLSVPPMVRDQVREGPVRQDRRHSGAWTCSSTMRAQELHPFRLKTLTFEQWTLGRRRHLTGAFLCTQEAIKLMKSSSSGGRIVNKVPYLAHARGRTLLIHRDEARDHA